MRAIPILLLAAGVALAQAAPANADAVVAITPMGLLPKTVTIKAGEGIHWTNTEAVPRRVTADSRVFDSGELGPGAGYSVALSAPGVHTYRVGVLPEIVGQIRVVLDELHGPPGAPVADYVPDLPFLPPPENDAVVHPDIGVTMSRSRLLVGFTPATTVAEANQALSRAEVSIVGGLPDLNLLLVEVTPRAPGFGDLDRALAVLKDNGVVELVSVSPNLALSSLPAPAEAQVADSALAWTWWLVRDGNGRFIGNGGNWGLEASRFPQAWNLLDVVRRRNTTIDTADIDGGFQTAPGVPAHVDLSRLVVRSGSTKLCRGFLFFEKCWDDKSNGRDDHGSLVAGVIGADYDNRAGAQSRSLGISGANPVARVHGFPYTEHSDWPSLVEYTTLVLREKTSGRMPGLRVLNFEHQLSFAVPNKRTCGPGQADDDKPGSNQLCTPNNSDQWLEYMAGVGDVSRKLAESASSGDVMIVQPAGNASDLGLGVISAEKAVPFARASATWNSPVANPIIVVEALRQNTLTRAAFSNRGRGGWPAGDTISAPGTDIVSTSFPHVYRRVDGTSFAAPFVAGLLGYLLAYEPGLGVADLRKTVLAWARDDANDATTSPRLDAFASTLSLKFAARDLVNVNDSSKDGNRRRTLGPQGGSNAVLPLLRIDPDTEVDMRDFRAFRDAWLATCRRPFGNPASCVPPGRVGLDGGDLHPKRDLNLDGCVSMHAVGDPCPSLETEYSRFDFNGDGRVDRAQRMLMPLEADGDAAAGPRDATAMTDLEVLASQWTDQGGEGWGPGNLDSLLESADLEIHADDFFAAGASEVDVRICCRNGGQPFPGRTIRRSDGFIVATTPVASPPAAITVSATATAGGETIVATPVTLQTLDLGEDRRVDLCVAGIELTASNRAIRADGRATSNVTARLRPCTPADANVGGRPITFSLAPSGTGHASVAPVTATTNASGTATTTFTAGTEVADYVLTATATLASGVTVRGKLKLRTVPELRIAYVWQQRTLEWWQEGATRWPGPVDPRMPDCARAQGVPYCVDWFRIELHPSKPSEPLTRKGTLVGGGSSFALTEEVGANIGWSQSRYTLTAPVGGQMRFGREESTWRVQETDRTHYKNHRLPSGVFVRDLPSGLELHGLQEIAKASRPSNEIGYLHSLVSATTEGTEDPIELHAVEGELLLIPRLNALRFTNDLKRPILFPRKPDGSFDSYEYCGNVEHDLTETPGYRQPAVNPFLSSGLDLERKRQYTTGDRPMPVGPGRLRLQYSFAAVPAYGNTVPTVTLPNCPGRRIPTADFEFTPDQPKEGRLVRFFDRSRDRDNDIVRWQWDLGDGTTRTTRDASRLYTDDGTYTVTLTVTDEAGNSATTSKQLVVVNLPPEIGLACVPAQAGQPVTIPAWLWDPSLEDRAALAYTLESSNTTFPRQTGTASSTDFAAFTIQGGLPAGTYPLALIVTDKNHAQSRARATCTITAAPPPPRPQLPAAPTCDPRVALDGEERELLKLINDYRRQNDLDPVVASPALTKAANGHAKDMADHRFQGHVGTDDSTLTERTRAAGYPETKVGENVGSEDAGWAANMIHGWKSSWEGHNELLLEPDWIAVGLARHRGGLEWYWAADFGDVDDCPNATPPLRALARHVRVSARATSTIDASAQPAFVMSTAQPAAGERVGFTNLSEDARGVGVQGTLVVVGRNVEHTLSIPFNETMYLTFGEGGAYRAQMTAGGAATQVSVRRAFNVGPERTSVTFLGPTSGTAATEVRLTARLLVVRTGEPARFSFLDFSVGDVRARGRTELSGTAAATLTLPSRPGTYPVRVSFAGDSRHQATQASASLRVDPRPIGAGRIASVAGAWTGPTLATKTGQAPVATAVHGNTLYVADAQADQIKAVDLRTGNETLVAGNGTRGSGGDGGPAAVAQLALPQGLTANGGLVVDAGGNLYVAETDNNKVRRITAGGTISTFAGTGARGFRGDGGPAAAARFDHPRGLALDGAGNLYVADFGNKRIRKIDRAGRISTTANLTSSPTGVAVRPNGNLLVVPGPAVSSNGPTVLEITSNGVTSTFAGGGGSTADFVAASIARFTAPVNVAVDPTGNVYVVDNDDMRIRVIDRAGTVSTWAGAVTPGGEPDGVFSGDGRSAVSANLSRPTAVAFDAAGNGYIADRGNHRIRKVNGVGQISTVAGGDALYRTSSCCVSDENGPALTAQLGRPGALAVAPNGDLVMVDLDNWSVHTVKPTGALTRLAGLNRLNCQCYVADPGDARDVKLERPDGVAVDAAGRVYVGESENSDYGYIHRVDYQPEEGDQFPFRSTLAGNGFGFEAADGTPATSGNVVRPIGFAVDRAGSLYFAESGTHRVRKIGVDGVITTVAGTGAPGTGGDGGQARAAQLRSPEDVEIAADGTLYIADTGNHKVRKVAPSGVIATVAGSGVAGFAGDGGAAAKARLNQPSDLALDIDGSLFVADRANNRVRLITPAGIVLTIAGDGSRGIRGGAGLPAAAALERPDGIALDRKGNLLVSAGPRVWRLRVPAGPTFYVSDVRVRERQSGTRNVKVTVSLLSAATTPVTIAYTTADGSASSAADYVTKTGTLTFAAGELSKHVTVPIKSDELTEGDELFELRLSRPTAGAVLGDTVARIVVRDQT